MKNLIERTSKILGVLLFVGVINLNKCHVFAQQSTMPSSVVKESFNNEFESAINTTWQKIGPVQRARFSQNGEFWVAYLSERGSLIASGRNISYDQLPIMVQKELKPARKTFEIKYGALEQGSIYEMVKDGVTEYYIPLNNKNRAMLLKASSGGGIVVAKNRKINTPTVATSELLAKH